jgi:hypothetical protein
MAKLVDQFSTLENFRTTFNEVSTNVGDIRGLRTTDQHTLVDAVNSIEDKSFFFQEFVFIATAGQQVFSGADSYGNILEFKRDRLQVYVERDHQIKDDDYNIGGFGVLSGNTFSQITLTTGANLGDKITVYSYTGSYLGVADSGAANGFFNQTAENIIYNNNDSGIIFNETSINPTTTLTTSAKIEFDGDVYHQDNVTLASSKTLTAPTLTDGTMSINSGAITSATTGSFSGNVGVGSLTSSGDVAGTTGTFSSSISATSGTFTGSLSTTQNLTVTGNTTLNGNIDLGNASSDTITLTGSVDSDIISDANNTRALGSSGNRWSDLYAVDINASGTSTLTTVDINGGNIDGTTIGGTTAGAITGTTITANTNFVGDLTGDVTGTVSDISNHDTGDLTEGSNLYYTSTRANSDFDTRLATKDTGDLTEGSNLYYTDARVSTRTDTILNHSNHTNITVSKVGDELRLSATEDNLANNTLDDISDVNYTTSPSAGQILAWDDSAGYWEPVDPSNTTDNVSEGSNNKYFSDDRMNAILDVASNKGLVKTYVDNADGGADDPLDGTITIDLNTSNGLTVSSNSVQLDYETTSTAPTQVGSTSTGHLWFVI